MLYHISALQGLVTMGVSAKRAGIGMFVFLKSRISKDYLMGGVIKYLILCRHKINLRNVFHCNRNITTITLLLL